jgi:hypothetical protein
MAERSESVCEVIRQLSGFGNAEPAQFTTHFHQELATLVIFAKQMPADLKRASRIEIERGRVQFLKLFEPPT